MAGIVLQKPGVMQFEEANQLLSMTPSKTAENQEFSKNLAILKSATASYVKKTEAVSELSTLYMNDFYLGLPDAISSSQKDSLWSVIASVLPTIDMSKDDRRMFCFECVRLIMQCVNLLNNYLLPSDRADALFASLTDGFSKWHDLYPRDIYFGDPLFAIENIMLSANMSGQMSGKGYKINQQLCEESLKTVSSICVSGGTEGFDASNFFSTMLEINGTDISDSTAAGVLSAALYLLGKKRYFEEANLIAILCDKRKQTAAWKSSFTKEIFDEIVFSCASSPLQNLDPIELGHGFGQALVSVIGLNQEYVDVGIASRLLQVHESPSSTPLQKTFTGGVIYSLCLTKPDLLGNLELSSFTGISQKLGEKMATVSPEWNLAYQDGVKYYRDWGMLGRHGWLDFVSMYDIEREHRGENALAAAFNIGNTTYYGQYPKNWQDAIVSGALAPAKNDNELVVIIQTKRVKGPDKLFTQYMYRLGDGGMLDKFDVAVIEPGSDEETLRLMQEIVARKGKKISKLIISGHGSAEVILLKGSRLSSEQPEYFDVGDKEIRKQMLPLLVEGRAEIILNACSTAGNPYTPGVVQDLATEVASDLHARVFANASEATGLRLVSFKPSSYGGWEFDQVEMGGQTTVLVWKDGRVTGVKGSKQIATDNFQVAAYPNPASQHVYFDFSKLPEGANVEVRLFNPLGQEIGSLMQQPATTQPVKVSLAGLPAGIYFYDAAITQDGRLLGHVSKKIIKQ